MPKSEGTKPRFRELRSSEQLEARPENGTLKMFAFDALLSLTYEYKITDGKYCAMHVATTRGVGEDALYKPCFTLHYFKLSHRS